MAGFRKIVNEGTYEITIPEIVLFGPTEAIDGVISAIARDYIELAMLDVAGLVSEEAPRNFGTLAASFTAYPAGPTGGVEIMGASLAQGIGGRVFSSLPYASVMNTGRQAGKPISRAGVAMIGLWVRRKLGLSGDEARDATYAIAAAIRKRGIVGKFYVRRALNKAEPRLASLFATMNQAIADGLQSSGRSA